MTTVPAPFPGFARLLEPELEPLLVPAGDVDGTLFFSAPRPPYSPEVSAMLEKRLAAVHDAYLLDRAVSTAEDVLAVDSFVALFSGFALFASDDEWIRFMTSCFPFPFTAA